MRSEIDSIQTILPLTVVDAHVVGDPASESTSLLDAGILAARSGEREHARSLLLRATEDDPRLESAWMWLASISESPEELLGFLDRVLSINPENDRARDWRMATNALLSKNFVRQGIEAVESRDLDAAAECFNRALDHDENCVSAWAWLAKTTVSHDEKLVYLNKVISLEPENEEALHARGVILAEFRDRNLNEAKAAAVAGRFAEANLLLNDVLAKDPRCAEAWTLRSMFSQTFTGKLEAFERLLEVEPDNVAAKMGLESLRSIASAAVEPEPEPIASPETELFPDSVAVAAVESGSGEFAPDTVAEATDEVPAAFGTFEFDDFHSYSANVIDEPIAAEIAVEFPETFAPSEVEEIPEIGEPFYAAELQEAYLHASIDVGPVAPEDDDSGQFDPFATLYGSNSAEQTSVNEELLESVVHDFAPADDEWQVSYPVAESGGEDSLPGIPMPSVELETAPVTDDYATYVEPTPEAIPMDVTDAPDADCPYCSTSLESGAIRCRTCRAVLTLADVEMVISNPHVDQASMHAAVRKMENERTRRELNSSELATLGIAYLNTQDLDAGFACLAEAARQEPENVVLAGQVNALHIRLEEIRLQAETRSGMTRGKTILVVDDSPTVLKLISGKLEKCGHEVFCSVDGEAAMELLENLIPDLVLLDINMPKMDGYQVCKLIRGNPVTRDIPVVMISGKDGFFDKVRGRMAGASGYVTKPFGPETLMKVIEGHLSGHVTEDHEFEGSQPE